MMLDGKNTSMLLQVPDGMLDGGNATNFSISLVLGQLVPRRISLVLGQRLISYKEKRYH
jgi:hypothetical protein